MNSINNNVNKINLYNNSNVGQVAKNSGQNKVHHHHHKKEMNGDSIEISQQALQGMDKGLQNNNNPLSSLVTSGVITQDQANAVQSAFQAGGRNIQAGGTYGNRPKNPLDGLVSDGTITKDQESAIKNSFVSSRKDNHQHHHGIHGQNKNTLDGLVTNGTITQDQENAIKTAFDTAMKAGGSNDDNRDVAKTNPLDGLVTNGTLTQDQEDAIKNAFDMAMRERRPELNNMQESNTISE